MLILYFSYSYCTRFSLFRMPCAFLSYVFFFLASRGGVGLEKILSFLSNLSSIRLYKIIAYHPNVLAYEWGCFGLWRTVSILAQGGTGPEVFHPLDDFRRRFINLEPPSFLLSYTVLRSPFERRILIVARKILNSFLSIPFFNRFRRRRGFFFLLLRN